MNFASFGCCLRFSKGADLASPYFTPVAKNRLEMRALFLARDDGDLDLLETGGFEKLMELHFAEAQPVIRVKLAGPLEAVAEQIEDHDAAALAQDCGGRWRWRARDGSRDATPG